MSEVNNLLPSYYRHPKYKPTNTKNSLSELSYDSIASQSNLHKSESSESAFQNSAATISHPEQLLNTWNALKSTSKRSSEEIAIKESSAPEQIDKEYIFIDNQWTEVHGIGCLDIDDGFASLEFYDTGEIHYINRLNKNACWSLDVTQAQLEKAMNLDVSFTKYMCSKSFWDAFLTNDITSDKLSKIAGRLNQKETYDAILDNLSDAAKNAWLKTEAETGINGFLTDGKGNMLCLSEFARKYVIASIKSESTDFLGSTKESMLKFATETLEDLNSPNRVVYNKELQEIKNSERNFYQRLIENLESI